MDVVFARKHGLSNDKYTRICSPQDSTRCQLILLAYVASNCASTILLATKTYVSKPKARGLLCSERFASIVILHSFKLIIYTLRRSLLLQMICGKIDTSLAKGTSSFVGNGHRSPQPSSRARPMTPNKRCLQSAAQIHRCNLLCNMVHASDVEFRFC